MPKGRFGVQDEGRVVESLSEEDLQLPEDKKQSLLDFVLDKWTEDTDVSDWNVEEMKKQWDG